MNSGSCLVLCPATCGCCIAFYIAITCGWTKYCTLRGTCLLCCLSVRVLIRQLQISTDFTYCRTAVCGVKKERQKVETDCWCVCLCVAWSGRES